MLDTGTMNRELTAFIKKSYKSMITKGTFYSIVYVMNRQLGEA